MSSTGLEGSIGAYGLRERLPNDPAIPQQAASSKTAQSAVKALNDDEEKKGKTNEEKRTYGRTPDGTGAYQPPVAKAQRCPCSIAVAMNEAISDNQVAVLVSVHDR